MTTTVINIRGIRDLRGIELIDRTTVHGNPFILGKHGNRDQVCNSHETYFLERVENDLQYRTYVLALKDCVLGCWCAPLRCHGHTIARWLDNGPRS